MWEKGGEGISCRLFFFLSSFAVLPEWARRKGRLFNGNMENNFTTPVHFRIINASQIDLIKPFFILCLLF